MTERMRIIVLALLVGLYAAAEVILAPIDLIEPESLVEHIKFAALGIFLVPPALLAFIAVFGPWSWIVRLPLSTWLTCILGLLLTYGCRLVDFGFGLSSDAAEWISFCFAGPLAEYLMLLPPLALLRFVRRWRLEAPKVDAAQSGQTMASSSFAVTHSAAGQFTIRSLLVWTLAAASIFAGLRWILTEQDLGGSTWGDVLLAGMAQGAMLGILLTVAALPVLSIAWLLLAWQRRSWPRLALASMTAAGIAGVLFWQWSMDHDPGTLLIGAFIETGVIGTGLASMAVIRACDYRLTRRPRGDARAPQSAAPNLWPQRRMAEALGGLVVAAIALAWCVPARIEVWRKASLTRHWAARGLDAMLDPHGAVLGLEGDVDRLTEDEMRHLADKLPDLTTLNFESLRDSQLAALAVPAGLETLSISDFRFTDKGLEHLPRFRQLRELNLQRTSITDAGLPHLAVLDELFRLDLSLTDVTDEGLRALMQCKQLRAIDLSLTAVSEAGARRLSEALPDATIIVGACDNMLSRTAPWLPRGGVARLERLHACGKYQGFGPPRRRPMPAATSVTDVGLTLLNPTMELKELDLRDTAVTDAGLPSLFPHKTLRRVDLRETAVTEAGRQRLANALPNCEILR